MFLAYPCLGQMEDLYMLRNLENLVCKYLDKHINTNINVDIYTYPKCKYFKYPNQFSLRFERTETINQSLRIGHNIP